MSATDDIELVRRVSGTSFADETPGYYDALKRVIDLAELTLPVGPLTEKSTIEGVHAWGTANYRGRIAAEHRADNYKALYEELKAKVDASE